MSPSKPDAQTATPELRGTSGAPQFRTAETGTGKPTKLEAGPAAKAGTSAAPAGPAAAPAPSKPTPGQRDGPDSTTPSPQGPSTGNPNSEGTTPSKSDDPASPSTGTPSSPATDAQKKAGDDSAPRHTTTPAADRSSACPAVEVTACPSPPANRTSEETPNPGPWMLQPQPILLVSLAIAGALLLGYLLALYLARRERDKLAAAREEIAGALKMPHLSLSEVPAELKSLEAIMSGVLDENTALETKVKGLEERLQQTELGPEARRAAAAADCLSDAAKSAETLVSADPDFGSIAGALDLVAGLRRSADALRSFLKEPSLGTQIGRLLEQGDFDSSLTASAILEKYFSERFGWREARVGVKAADALLVSLLESASIQIVDVPILSVLGRHDIRDVQVSDRRGLRSIPAIQQRAARIARDLQPNEMLVVDCHKPGWISDRVGSRSPHLAIFDPASWT